MTVELFGLKFTAEPRYAVAEDGDALCPVCRSRLTSIIAIGVEAPTEQHGVCTTVRESSVLFVGLECGHLSKHWQILYRRDADTGEVVR